MLPSFAVLATLLAAPIPQAGDPLAAAVQHALEFSLAQLDRTAQSIASTRYPSATTSSGAWATTSASAWTSGFFPGCLWLAYDWDPDARRRAAGEAWLVALEGEKDDTSTHDVGFKIFPSFGNAYRLTGDVAQRAVVLEGAASLATRYSPIVRATRSWNGPSSSDFRVFFGARNGGDPSWYDIAVNHALTTRAQHVRPDGSTYQLVNFDPATGRVKAKGTHQGYDDESTWSRGQAWAVYGFTLAYRESGDARFLDTARATAEYFVTHLPADAVPYWDFELPSTAGEPRDSSAAAVAAAGLLELARIEPDSVRADRWLASARAMLKSLCSSNYLSEGTGDDSILRHGTQNRPDGRLDTGLIYGDYYFVQALLRYQRWFDLAPRTRIR
jgi:unsaturated chondroitin disaccharide hydrolase